MSDVTKSPSTQSRLSSTSSKDERMPNRNSQSGDSSEKKSEKIKCHQGFYQQYNSVRNDLWAIVKMRLEDNDDIEEIFITGHSMGGALTILCAFDLAFNVSNLEGNCWKLLTENNFFESKSYFQQTSDSITKDLRIKSFPIAAPRTGNQAFHNAFEKLEQIHCDRLVIDLDQVPKIPRPFMGYKHVGRKIKLCDSKDLTRLDKINPTKIHHYSNYLKSILGRGINLFRFFRISNFATLIIFFYF